MENHYSQINATLNSSSQELDILKTARLNSTNANEFAIQLFNASTNLIHPQTPLSSTPAPVQDLNGSLQNSEENSQASPLPNMSLVSDSEDSEDDTEEEPHLADSNLAESQTDAPESPQNEANIPAINESHKVKLNILGQDIDNSTKHVKCQYNPLEKTFTIISLDSDWKTIINKEMVTNFQIMDRSQQNALHILLNNGHIYKLRIINTVNDKICPLYVKNYKELFINKLDLPFSLQD